MPRAGFLYERTKAKHGNSIRAMVKRVRRVFASSMAFALFGDHGIVLVFDRAGHGNLQALLTVQQLIDGEKTE